MFAFREGVGYS